MDVQTIIAAAPVVRKVWKVTPTSLRVPLVAAGLAFVAWRYLSGSGDDQAGSGTVPVGDAHS